MKPLIFAVVAASVAGFSAGAYACGAAHTASAESNSIVVAQQQTPSTPATPSSQSQSSQKN